MRKIIICMIAIAIMTLLITSTFGMAGTPSSGQSNKIKINKINATPERFSTNSQKVDIIPTQNPNPKGANLAFPGLHPGFGRSIGGTMFAGYYEPTSEEIVWTYSIDDGSSFDPGIFYEGLGGDYPAIKLWDGDDVRFFGTYVTDYNDVGGGATYLYEVNDATQLDDTTLNPLTYWDWSTYGWYDMIDADIACDNSKNTFEWGVSSYVISTTYASSPYTNGPTIVYSDEATEGSGWISWYNYNGCAHTDVDIDPTTHYAYSVYDWLNDTTWKLLVRVNDFANIMTGFDTVYEIEGGGNLKNPAVAAYGDKVVVLAQTDENGNDDIICLYSDDKFVTVQSSFVADSVDNEMYPDVRFDNDGNFICTYVMNNNLYALESDDGGATWIEPTKGQVNTNDDVVVEEYKTSDLGDLAIKGMWEETGTEGAEIWIGDVAAPSNLPPLTPTINGQTKLKRFINYEFTFTTTDPDGDDVSYYVDWGDGTNSGWTTPSASGVVVALSHKWTTKAAFIIKCKAKDTSDAESDWGILEVSTPRVVMKPMIIQKILERFPHAFPILRYLLGV